MCWVRFFDTTDGGERMINHQMLLPKGEKSLNTMEMLGLPTFSEAEKRFLAALDQNENVVLNVFRWYLRPELCKKVGVMVGV